MRHRETGLLLAPTWLHFNISAACLISRRGVTQTAWAVPGGMKLGFLFFSFRKRNRITLFAISQLRETKKLRLELMVPIAKKSAEMLTYLQTQTQ
jgi:hypothetical protein